MSTTPRRKFKDDFKAKVAIAAIKEQLSIEDICKKFEIHPTQANLWKREFLANASQLFDKENKYVDQEDQEKSYKNCMLKLGN